MFTFIIQNAHWEGKKTTSHRNLLPVPEHLGVLGEGKGGEKSRERMGEIAANVATTKDSANARFENVFFLHSVFQWLGKMGRSKVFTQMDEREVNGKSEREA